MSSYSKNEIVLIKYPFTSLSTFKIRPAVIVSSVHPSNDIIIVPITSNIHSLQPGEFILNYWKEAGLNIPSTVKRGIFTVEDKLVIKSVGRLYDMDIKQLELSLFSWLGLI
jgi:mRNA interferase MazF